MRPGRQNPLSRQADLASRTRKLEREKTTKLAPFAAGHVTKIGVPTGIPFINYAHAELTPFDTGSSTFANEDYYNLTGGYIYLARRGAWSISTHVYFVAGAPDSSAAIKGQFALAHVIAAGGWIVDGQGGLGQTQLTYVDNSLDTNTSWFTTLNALAYTLDSTPIKLALYCGNFLRKAVGGGTVNLNVQAQTAVTWLGSLSV